MVIYLYAYIFAKFLIFNRQMNDILTLKERLIEIVETSYRILCNKIVLQSINIPNESSFQLHFGVILKQIGLLYEFEDGDRFSIQLEDVQSINSTQKRKNGKAMMRYEQKEKALAEASTF